MTPSRNTALAAAMAEYGLTRAALADAVNAALHRSGNAGLTSERWVYYLLDGSVLWPTRTHRQALEEVFAVPAERLGFVPPGGTRPVPPPARGQATRRLTLGVSSDGTGGHNDVDRRKFLLLAGAGTGAGAFTLALPALHAQTRLGMSDVEAMRAPLRQLVALDARRGGAELAPAAEAAAARIHEALKRCTASDRVRRAGYSLAGEYLAGAGWFAIDATTCPPPPGTWITRYG